MNEKLLRELKSNPTPENVRAIAVLTGLPLVMTRKSLIAAYMRTGKSVADAVAHFSLTPTIIRTACKEAGIKLPPSEASLNSSPPAYKIIADVVNGLRGHEIAGKHKVSKQAVSQVRQKLLAAGCKLPK